MAPKAKALPDKRAAPALPSLPSSEPLLKRLRANDEPRRKLSWRNPSFTDWVLVWGQKQFHVHRVILACGERPAHFFAAAANAATMPAFGETSTDLSKLLPPPSEAVIEQILDHIYEGHFHAEPKDLPVLHMAGDILQCPSLQNDAAEMMEPLVHTADVVAMMDSALKVGNERVIEELALKMPRSSLAKVVHDVVSSNPRVAGRILEEIVSAPHSLLLWWRPKDDSARVSSRQLSVMGRYQECGARGGRPVFKHMNGSSFIYFKDNAWRIASSPDATAALYKSRDKSPRPPAGGWLTGSGDNLTSLVVTMF